MSSREIFKIQIIFGDFSDVVKSNKRHKGGPRLPRQFFQTFSLFSLFFLILTFSRNTETIYLV